MSVFKKPPRATTGELWAETDHPDYIVSTLGRVISYARSPKGRLLKPGLTSAGYPSVSFGRGDTRLVHRLVATAFLGPIPEGQEVRHKDDDRTNPAAWNLEYGTRQDNVNDMMRRGGYWSDRRKAYLTRGVQKTP